MRYYYLFPKISGGHVTHYILLSGVIDDAALVLICINQHTKYEVPSFTKSKGMIGATLKAGHVTLTTPNME